MLNDHNLCMCYMDAAMLEMLKMLKWHLGGNPQGPTKVSQSKSGCQAVRCDAEKSGSCSSCVFWELSSHLIPFGLEGPGASSQPPGTDLPKQIESTNGMAAKANLVSIARKLR
jgi:hypothetical protein